MNTKQRCTQILIALDQLINTLVWDGDSYSDETLSARSWRSRDKRRWKYTQAVIDRFFYVCFRQADHCYTSYVSERARMQMPPEYRA